MTRGGTACQKTGKGREVFNHEFCEPLFANTAQMEVVVLTHSVTDTFLTRAKYSESNRWHATQAAATTSWLKHPKYELSRLRIKSELSFTRVPSI